MTLGTDPRCHVGRVLGPALGRQLGAATGAVLAGLLLLGGCAEQGGERSDRAALTGSETAPTDEATIDPQIAPSPSSTPTPIGGAPWDDGVSRTCADTVPRRMAESAQVPVGSGVTSFWVGSSQVAMCDVLLDAESGDSQAVTVVPAPRNARTGFDEGRLALTATVVGDEDAPDAVRYVAGGLLPWPVEQISYTFPDGHTAEAQFVESEDGSGDTWWVVGYTATEGALVDPSTSTADLAPVTISIVGAAAEAFRLPWEDLQRDG